ncbi:polyprenyl synthetase family protein [Candidatus Uhrbacteria bacterium]|nr:polyprenyl synthetase family protein [Candidatus Uhrbacteria bacterium]
MKKISSYSALTKNQDITELIAYTEKLARGGGKRIRPFLAWLMYQGLAGKKQEAILDASIALEIFHLFGLMHDDIIDRGTDRHGIPTVHLAVMKRLKQQKRIGDLHHIGEGQAMLLGDLLFSWSVEIMTNTIKFGEKKHAQAQQRFFRMVDEVILGQMLDVETMTNSIANMQSIEEKMRLKTASYTCIRPLQIGAALAGTNERIDLFCKNIGLSLGLAFQIQDDFLDLTADQKKIKKTVFSDLTEHQHTIFTQYIFDQGTRAQKNELKSLMGSPLDEKDRPRILELFETSGAFSYGKKQIEAHFNQAEDCLQSFKLKPIAKTGLSDLLMYLRHRQI